MTPSITINPSGSVTVSVTTPSAQTLVIPEGVIIGAGGPPGPIGNPGPTGSTGPIGPANTLSIGVVTNGTAAATITGTAPTQVLNLTLPTGAAGNAATVTSGTATSLAPGFTPTVNNVGTSSAAIFNFGIPTGATGPQGPAGVGTLVNMIRSAQANMLTSGVTALSGAVNGTNPTFTTPDGLYASGTLQIYLNGVLQPLGDAITQTAPASGIFTFVTAPSVGDQILANYTIVSSGSSLAAVAFSGVKADVGLGSVDNTSDINKPVSTAQATSISTKEPAITTGTTAQFWRGDKTFQSIPTPTTISGSVTESQVTNLVTDLAATEKIANKNAVNGYAGLDGGGKVPTSILPASVLGALEYQGTYDASTTIYPASPSKGYYWVISVAGTISGTAYAIGDWLTYDGVGWDKIDNSQKVSSVAGRIGAVVIAESDVTNLTTDLAAKAPLASPSFTGTVTVPVTVNSTDAAQKAYVDATTTLHALIPTAVKTSNYTAIAGDFVMVDATSGAITITAPTLAAGVRWGVRLVTAVSNTVTLSTGSGTFDTNGLSTLAMASGTGTALVDVTFAGNAAGTQWIGTTSGKPNSYLNTLFAGVTEPLAVKVAGDIGGTVSAPTVVSTHLSLPLPVPQGGTGVTTNTGSGSNVLSTAPVFTGTPTAPTATALTNNTQLATTAYADASSAAATVADTIHALKAGDTFTGLVTLSSTSAGMKLFNTVDQVTNPEYGSIGFTTNTLLIQTNFAGTGTNRDIQLQAGGGGLLRVRYAQSNLGAFTLSRSLSVASTVHTALTGTHTQSSGTVTNLAITPTYNQTSTAGGTDILVNRTQTAVGSGSHRFLDFQVAGTTLTYVKNDGVYFPVQATTASAPTYVKGGMYFDTTLNKLRIGGATAWETVTST